MSFLLKDGFVVFEKFIKKTDILIEKDKISKIGPNLEVTSDIQVIDCSNKYIFPGIIDAHVHFDMQVKQSESTIDDFYSGSIAAASGGVTTIIDYVEPQNEEMPLEAVLNRKKVINNKICVDYNLHYVIKKWETKYINQLEKLIQQGITSFKIFTTYDHMKLSYNNIVNLLSWSKKNNVLITVHAEDDETIKTTIDKLRKENKLQASFHAKSRPIESELLAVKKILDIVSKLDTPIYFVHISSYQAAKIIQLAQKKGQKVYAETCPHYLLLNDNFYERTNPQLFIMCPPLREESERMLLWKALQENIFSVIATDHCAFSKKQKLLHNSFLETYAGIPGVETLLPLIFSEGVVTKKIDLIKAINLLSINPAKIFGLYPRKGSLQKGSDADIVIFNPNKKVKIDHQMLNSKCDYSPYQGKIVTGYPEMTFLRGNIIYKNNKFCGKKGFGKFIPAKKLIY